MQANVLTLAVNVDNDNGTTPAVDLVLTRFDEYQNRSEYIASGHSLSARDKLGLYRTLPKATGNFRGQAKCSVKFTKDISVPGVDVETSVISPQLIEISISNPVGTTAAQSLEMRMRAVAILLDSAIMGPLVDQQMI